MTVSDRSTRGSALVVIVLLIVAVALASAAYYFLRERTSDSPPATSSTSASKGETLKAATEDEAATRQKTSLIDEGPKKSDKAIAFTIVCLGPEGASEPIANAEVRAAPAVPTGVDRANEKIVRTDASGVAQFTDMPYSIYDVSSAPAGFVPLRLRGAKDGKRLELIFRRGAPLSGVVTNSLNGSPVADAYIQIRSDFGLGAVTRRIQQALRQGVEAEDIDGHEVLTEPQAFFRTEAITDAEGRFSAASVPLGFQVDVNIDHDDFDPLTDKFETKEATPVEKSYVLVPRTEIFGKVLADESGEPVVGAKVQAGEGGIPPTAIGFFGAGSAHIFEAVADLNGAYRLKRIPRGKQSLYVRYPGYTDFVATFEVNGAEPYPFEIRLKRAASLVGQVVDSANNPLEGVDLYWLPTEAGMLGRAGLPREPQARSGADGTFQLHGLPVSRTFSVLARHADFVEVQQDNFVLQPGEEMTGVTIMMNRGGQITGSVLDTNRHRLAGARITARPVNPIGPPCAPISTGPDGTFVIMNTQPALHEITCELPGHVTSMNANVRDFATGVQFVMVKEAVYSGRFLDSDNKPLTRFRVRIRATEAVGTREIRTESIRDKDGKFAIKGLGPRLWDFESTADGITPLVVPRIALREGEVLENQELHAKQGASVGGVVKSQTGNPVRAGLVSMEFLETFSSSDQTFTTLRAPTNATGEFTIKNLLPGRYRIWCSHPQFAPSGEREIVVEEGPRAQIDFTLPKPASLRLVVRDKAGNTIPAAEAWLFQGESPLDGAKKVVKDGLIGLQLPKLDAARDGFGAAGDAAGTGGPKFPVGETGEITFSRRAPGDWTIWVTAEGFYKYMDKIKLEAGKEAVHEAVLEILQAGMSQKDAYRTAQTDPHPDRQKRKDTNTAEDKSVKLTPEEQALVTKQRNGDELSPDELKMLKEIRRKLRSNAKADGETAGDDADGAKKGKGKGKGKGKPSAPEDEKKDG